MRRRFSFLRIDGKSSSMFFKLHLLILATSALLARAGEESIAQQPAAANALVVPGGQQNGMLFGGPNAANATGQQGGAANADFDSLIDLITSTVQPDLWVDAGGTGDVRPFFGGVLVDAAGTLQLRSQPTTANELIAKRGAARIGRTGGMAASASRSARSRSPLRYISLPRLEREIARRQAAREPLEPSMLTLAGLQRVEYVFVYPQIGDLVLAGAAGDWQVSDEGRVVSSDTGHPVVRLDDLLVLLRRGPEAAESFFGCSINPKQQALAETQVLLASTSQRPLQPSERMSWLGKLRDSVGLQDIEIFGIDPSSRVASLLVEADYHMKLIGMGLVDGVEGVESYLDSIKLAPGEAPPAMSVLRWWFTLHYDHVAASPERDAFQLVGQGVRVLSENELLAERGQRVHTGQSDPLNRQFAENFTTHFAELVAKYPVYGELRNIFDLAMVMTLIHTEGLFERVHWQPVLLASNEQLRLPQGAVPRQVETVVNHRVINRRHIVAGVSGGVMVAPSDVLKVWHNSGDKRLTKAQQARPAELADEIWWWDAAE